MLIVLAIAIPAIWIAAILLRRRYIRKRDREIEMRPPVAIGPHQVQAMSGGELILIPKSNITPWEPRA